MAITLTSAHAQNNTPTLTATISIPAGSSVAVIASMSSTNVSSAPGTCVDSNGTSYTPKATVGLARGFGFNLDTFVITNTSLAATSVTYTPPAVTTNFGANLMVWVLNP